MSLFEVELPQGWKWSRLGDHFEVARKPRGFQVQQSDVTFIPMDAIPQDGSFEPSGYVSKPVADISSGTYIERGNLLVAKITPSFENGKQALVEELPDEFGYATTEVIPLRSKSEGISERLAFYYLLHPEVRSFVAERMEGSTGRQRVPEAVLLDLPYPEPPSDLQGPIASLLGRVQRAIKIQADMLEVMPRLKQSTMATLFSHGLRDESLKDSEIGVVPESWTVEPFSSVRAWLQYGTSTRCTPERAAHAVLRIPNIGSGTVIPDDLKYCDMPESEAAKYRLELGDLIFIRTNGVLERLGSCAVYRGAPQQALFASYLIRARLDLARVEPRFVAHFYGSKLGTSMVAGRATPASDGKYNLNTGTIDALPLPVPPTLDEQVEIADILDAIDAKIALHQKKRAVLEELFKALLHKLMTGKIDVNDLDLSALQPTT